MNQTKPAPGPFDQLPKLLGTKEKQDREYQRIPGPNFALLAQGMTNVKIGERFGVSATAVAKYLRENLVPVSFELAATYILEEQTRKAEEDGKTDIFTLLRRIKAHYRQFDIFNIPKNEADMLNLTLRELLSKLGEVPPSDKV